MHQVSEHIPQLKEGNIHKASDCPLFSKDPADCDTYLKVNKHNSLHLTLKICSARVFCPWTSPVLQSSQFSSSFALGDCLLLETKTVHRKISKHIFAPNGGYCLYIAKLFCIILFKFMFITLISYPSIDKLEKKLSIFDILLY